MTNEENGATGPAWLAGASALVSFAACYGTLGVIAVLSLMGISLAVDERIWAGVIVAFAVLSVVGVTLGTQHHRNLNPSRLAIAGAVLIYWAMYWAENIRATLGVPSFVVELTGFAALMAAAYWDWRLKRRDRLSD